MKERAKAPAGAHLTLVGTISVFWAVLLKSHPQEL
jgi:hypothetical protein